MVARSVIITLVVSALLLSAPQAQAMSPQSANVLGNIAGQVTAADTGQPLAGVTVRARRHDAAFFQDVDYTTLTKPDGTYTMTVPWPDYPPSGRFQYRIAFEPAQDVPYVTQWFNNQPVEGLAQLVTIGSDTLLSGTNAALSRAGTVTGSVTTSDGASPAGLTVNLLDLEGKLLRSITPTASSAYSITGLATGTYRLSFNAPDYVYQYYSNALDWASSSAISVTAPNTVRNVNVQLQAGGTITGQLTAGDTGLPFYDSGISAIGPTGPIAGKWPFDRIFLNGPGAYLIRRLPPGNYRVFFSGQDYQYNSLLPQYFNARPNDPLSATLVSVSATAVVSNVDASLARGGGITGTVIAEDGGFQLDSTVSVVAPCAAPVYARTYEVTPFNLTGLPSGTYTLSVPASPYYQGESNSAYFPRSDITASVVAPNTSGPITIALRHGGQITGTISVPSGGQGSASKVQIGAYLVPSDTFQAYAQTDYYGQYAIQNLLPGTYKFKIRPHAGYSGYPAELYAFATPTTTVVITAAETVKDVNFALTELGSNITGKVIDKSTGWPLFNAEVLLLSSDGMVYQADYTDVAGDYELNNLAAGSYRLLINPIRENDPSGALPYLPEYFDGKSNDAVADIINITAPITLTNINAALTRGGQMIGKITDANGIAMGRVRVSAYDATNKRAAFVYSRDDGTYATRPGLPTGQYKVRYDYTSCNGVPYATVFYRNVANSDLTAQQAARTDGAGASFADATPVSVVAGQTTSALNMSLVTGASNVKGRVTKSGIGVAGFKLSLTNGAEVTTDATGAYTFTGVYTGSLAVAPSAGMSATTPTSRNVNTPDITSQDFTVGAPPVLNTISGRVTRNGIGVVGFVLNVSNGVTATTDATGNYTVAGLPAASYTITPAPGQAQTTPPSRTVSVPPNVADADLVAGSRTSLPIVVQLK